jgi:hypothetical protein
MGLPESVVGLPSQGRGVCRILKIVYFLENYIGNDDWQCRYIRGNALMYVVIYMVEKYVPYGELARTRESVTL